MSDLETPSTLDTPSTEVVQKPPRSTALPLVMVLAGLGFILAAFGALLWVKGAAPVVDPSAQPDQPVSGPPRVGRAIADFTLEDLSGQTVHLSDYAGRPVLINAWATWCPPCREEMPDLNALYQKYQENGFVILAVNAGEPADLVIDYSQQMDLDFPILLDPGDTVLNGLSINSYPTSILIGRDGLVKEIFIGTLYPDQIEEKITPHLQ